MAENQGSDNFGLRVLIALYAAGIVALGLPALKKHYGGLDGFIATVKKKTAVFAIDPESGRPELESEKRARQTTKAPESAEKKAPKPQLDNLKQSDRKQLNDLVNTL